MSKTINHEELDQRMAALKLSRASLSRMTGQHISTISAYATGKYPKVPQHIVTILELLELLQPVKDYVLSLQQRMQSTDTTEPTT